MKILALSYPRYLLGLLKDTSYKSGDSFRLEVLEGLVAILTITRCIICYINWCQLALN